MTTSVASGSPPEERAKAVTRSDDDDRSIFAGLSLSVSPFATDTHRSAPRSALDGSGSGSRGGFLAMTPNDHRIAAVRIFHAHRDWEIEHILLQCDARISEYLRPMVMRAAHNPNRDQ